jgi:hypothetical protein
VDILSQLISIGTQLRAEDRALGVSSIENVTPCPENGIGRPSVVMTRWAQSRGNGRGAGGSPRNPRKSAV